MRKGHWLLLDEINAALPEILFVLHSLLDDDRYIVLSENSGEVVRPHKNFRLFASMNPSGKYAGTKDLNKAFLSRFPIILQLDFPNPKEEEQILKIYAKKADDNVLRSLIKMAGDLRTSYKKDDIEFICSTRDLINCATISQDRGLGEALQLSILNRCQSEDEKAVRAVIQLYFGKDMAVASIIPDWEKEYIALERNVEGFLTDWQSKVNEAGQKVGKIIERKDEAMSDKEELEVIFEDVLPRAQEVISVAKSGVDYQIEEVRKKRSTIRSGVPSTSTPF
jgi:Holliday junction resolvasome RuvABC ATP-dependent DNA helicase subunit